MLDNSDARCIGMVPIAHGADATRIEPLEDAFATECVSAVQNSNLVHFVHADATPCIIDDQRRTFHRGDG